MDFAVSRRGDRVIQLTENTEDNTYHYSLEEKYMEVVGEGASGRVFVVKSVDDENRTIVIKDGYNKDSLRKDINNLEKLGKDATMCSAFYQNAVVVEDKSSDIKPFVIMKMAEGGDLLSFVQSLTRAKWPEEHPKEYCSIVAHLSGSMMDAVNCLSRQKVYYFDLKLENILVPTDHIKATEEHIQQLYNARCLLRLGDHGSMQVDEENITLSYWPLWMKEVSFQQGLKEMQHQRKLNVLAWLKKVNTILMCSIHDPPLYNSLRKHFSFSGQRLRMLNEEYTLRLQSKAEKEGEAEGETEGKGEGKGEGEGDDNGCYVWNHRRIYAKKEWNGILLEKEFIKRVVKNPESPLFKSKNFVWPLLLKNVFASEQTSHAFKLLMEDSSDSEAIEMFHQMDRENNYMANIVLANDAFETGTREYILELLTDFNFRNQSYKEDPEYFQKKADRLYAEITNGSFQFDPENLVDKVYQKFFEIYEIKPSQLSPSRVAALTNQSEQVGQGKPRSI
jgi:hypothetical protein